MVAETRPLLPEKSKTRPTPPPISTFSSGTVTASECGRLQGFGSNSLSTTFPSNIPLERRRRILIVGAGICGIQQAIILLKDGHSLDDITIFDSQDGFGGVWKKNIYPGCACDVPVMLYSTSWWLNMEWTHTFASREEIVDYYERMARKWRLNEVTRFRSYVKECVWDEEAFEWKVKVDVKGKGEEAWIADTVIHCVGQLDRPKFGMTKGLEGYKGKYWHTNLWPKDADIKGKKVAVVGCGSSAAQIIPSIVNEVESLTVYIRTPPVVLPRADLPLSQPFKWACKWIPFFAWLWRWKLTFDFGRNGRKGATDNSPRNDNINFLANRFMEKQVKDPELRKLLRPTAKFMCKRPLILSTLYPALSSPNCTVVREKLLTYTPTGILSSSSSSEPGSRDFDVVILGTGFNVAQYLEHVVVKGKGGLNLQDQWEEHPEALYGVAVSNFPNLFMNFGPNSSAPWLSHQDIATAQGKLVSKLIRRIFNEKRRKLAIAPKKEVERKYNEDIQREQKGFAWARGDCSTYYKNDEGWLTFTMPYTLGRWWWITGWVRWGEWEVWER